MPDKKVSGGLWPKATKYGEIHSGRLQGQYFDALADLL
jgi:hypothetical protein